VLARVDAGEAARDRMAHHDRRGQPRLPDRLVDEPDDVLR
jgi:hypothetical protein